ncbi:hypothetical protein IAR55_000783 [Kwoniella newhampshirensis]|uniref:Glycosyltransferase family 32 protein n=1 Tax=Kwoniella newhampshirensis TaxID=1651941 RepID=A0AAW0Z419_9TREE
MNPNRKGKSAWRTHEPHINTGGRGEGDGINTDSEAEGSGSARGWSDAGWNQSPGDTHARPSLSSSDDQPLPIALPVNNANESYDPSVSAAHRRASTLNRMSPSIHTVGSTADLDSLNPISSSNPHGTKLNMGRYPSPSNSSTGLASPLQTGYTQAGPSHVPSGPGGDSPTYNGGNNAYSRSRRKSVSQNEHDSDEEDGYLGGANGSASSLLSAKGKLKKRNRGSSFSYLPFHRRSRRGSSTGWPLRWLLGSGGKRSSAARRWGLPLLVLLGMVYGFVLWRRKYEIQVEFSVFSRQWIRTEIDQIEPLRGCFTSPLLSPEYNLTKHNAPKRHLLSAGISLKRGMSCYDFSSTIQPIPGVSLEPVTYHTYWRSDLIPFGERQQATFLSFLATQPLTHSKLILWTNGADIVSSNPYVKPYLNKWGEYIQVKQVEMDEWTKGTELQGVIGSLGSAQGGLFDERAWVDGDAVRLLVLWRFGGIWMDMDQVLTRDLHPLTETEWVTQWDCYDKPYFTLNGALMHFTKHSPYLCEAFHIMATSPLPKPNTFTWGSHLYSKLHRSLIASHIKPFSVLPWCFTDPRNCRLDNRFPDPFSPDPPDFAGKGWEWGGREYLEEKVGNVWAVHLHNQWNKRFPPGGWIERLLDGYRGQLDVLERYARQRGLVQQDGEIKLAKRGMTTLSNGGDDEVLVEGQAEDQISVG